MRMNFFGANFLNTPTGPGCLFQTRGRQTFEGGEELFDHHDLRVEDPPPHPVSGRKKLIFVL